MAEIGRDTVTLQAAGDAFLSSACCANANTCRAYAGVIDNLIAKVGAKRALASVADDELGAALSELWGHRSESTWNRNRAAVNSWLTWCATKKRWSAPTVPPDCERHREHVDPTKDLPRAAIERQLSRRDVPLREKHCGGARPDQLQTRGEATRSLPGLLTRSHLPQPRRHPPSR